MKCAFLGTKITAFLETAKRNLLKSVKGFEKVNITIPPPHPSISLSENLNTMFKLDVNEFSATGRLVLQDKKEVIISDVKDRIALMEAYSKIQTIITKYE